MRLLKLISLFIFVCILTSCKKEVCVKCTYMNTRGEKGTNEATVCEKNENDAIKACMEALPEPDDTYVIFTHEVL